MGVEVDVVFFRIVGVVGLLFWVQDFDGECIFEGVFVYWVFEEQCLGCVLGEMYIDGCLELFGLQVSSGIYDVVECSVDD